MWGQDNDVCKETAQRIGEQVIEYSRDSTPSGNTEAGSTT